MTFDPDAGVLQLGELTVDESLEKMRYHYLQARLASRRWELRKRVVLEAAGADAGRRHKMCSEDLQMRGSMDAFGFHERMSRLCADNARTEIFDAMMELKDGPAKI